MPYADFHVHGNFKTYFTGYDVQAKESPWKKINFTVDNFLFRKSNRIFSSQSSFSQLHKGQLGLGVMPLYSTERGFPDSFLLKALDFFSKKIDHRLFKAIRENKVTYYQQLDDCFKHLERAVTDNVPGSQSINFTRTFADIDPAKMNIVFSLEGAHAFLNSFDEVNTPQGLQDIEDRIKAYKKKNPAPGNTHPRIFILNVTHLTMAPFTNHSFGIKIISHEDFIPQGQGITQAGLRIIHTALSQDAEHHPMIIDIKHMSLESRKSYYQIRRQSYPDIPIVASHAGVTGISYEHVNDYIEHIYAAKVNKRNCNLVCHVKPSGLIPFTEFNPWSINLYDEDIAEILLSGGIIGISLDQRILGTGKVAREKMSKSETFPGITLDHPVVAKDPDEEAAIEDAELHFRHFCNNLFHILKVGSRTFGPGVDVWKQIVIASDFDGLIDAVDFCVNGEAYSNIGSYMMDKMPQLALEAGITLPYPLQPLIDGILYTNGYDFLKKYY